MTVPSIHGCESDGVSLFSAMLFSSLRAIFGVGISRGVGKGGRSWP